MQGERALIAHERAQHATPAAELLKQELRAALSPLLRAKNLVYEYRFHLLAGSWVGGMALASVYLSRKK